MKTCVEMLCENYGTYMPYTHEHELRLDRPKRMEFTGLFDSQGAPLYEGDILLEYINDYFGNAPAVVHWAPDKGAWISFGAYDGGGAHSSLNGEHFRRHEKIGSIETTPHWYFPAKKRA